MTASDLKMLLCAVPNDYDITLNYDFPVNEITINYDAETLSIIVPELLDDDEEEEDE